MSKSSKPLKVYFHTMECAGPQNASVGLAQALSDRGHSVTFLIAERFGGQFAKFGFAEIPLKRSPPPPQLAAALLGEDATNPEKLATMNPYRFGAELVLRSGIMGPDSPLEKLRQGKVVANEGFVQFNFGSVIDVNQQLADAITQGKPDLLLLDHFLVPPAFPMSGVPWLFVCSGNPICLFNSPDLPPYTSGYSIDSDRKQWDEFRKLQVPQLKLFSDHQRKLFDAFGYRYDEARDLPLPYATFPQSPFGYVYGYPKELDYNGDEISVDADRYIQLDTFCRQTSTEQEKGKSPFQVPPELNYNPTTDRLIYFSLGSMGAVDVDLVKRLCSVLTSRVPHLKLIVSKGPRSEQYDLPAGGNCWGAGYLPQTEIIPLVDAVITHGGNNTVTESVEFGKPMLVLPLFGDQHDNGERVQAKGFGVKLNPYTYKDQELVDAVDRILNDQEMRSRVAQAGQRIRTGESKRRAVQQIERLVAQYAK